MEEETPGRRPKRCAKSSNKSDISLSRRYAKRPNKDRDRKGTQRHECMESYSTYGGQKPDEAAAEPEKPRISDRFLKNDPSPGTILKSMR